jgi:hypothetical protein
LDGPERRNHEEEESVVPVFSGLLGRKQDGGVSRCGERSCGRLSEPGCEGKGTQHGDDDGDLTQSARLSDGQRTRTHSGTRINPLRPEARDPTSWRKRLSIVCAPHA